MAPRPRQARTGHWLAAAGPPRVRQQPAGRGLRRADLTALALIAVRLPCRAGWHLGPGGHSAAVCCMTPGGPLPGALPARPSSRPAPAPLCPRGGRGPLPLTLHPRASPGTRRRQRPRSDRGGSEGPRGSGRRGDRWKGAPGGPRHGGPLATSCRWAFIFQTREREARDPESEQVPEVVHLSGAFLSPRISRLQDRPPVTMSGSFLWGRALLPACGLRRFTKPG